MKFSTLLTSNIKIGLTTLGFAAFGMAALHAQIIDLTPDGTVILGLNNAGSYSTTGLNYNHNPGTNGNLTDGTTASPYLFTEADTYNTGVGSYDSSFVGFTFATPTTDAITTLTVNFELIKDGGWYGSPAVSINEGTQDAPNYVIQPLDSSTLTEPTLQYSLDGTNWVTASDTSNYMSTLSGLVPGSFATPQVTFSLNTPIAGLEGIRLIGPSGGAAQFIAIPDERVFGEIAATPEPATWAMMLLGVSVLILGIRRRRET